MGNAVSNWIEMFNGVIQGSVLGPVRYLWDLFGMHINNMLKKIINPAKLYANDKKVIVCVNNIEQSKKLQEDIDKLDEWSDQWATKFNFDKCKIMHIGTKNRNYEHYGTLEHTVQQDE